MSSETIPTIIKNEPLARYTAWRIGGPARWFGVAASADELVELIAWGRERALPIFVLGGGSNVLIADGGYAGLVIRSRAAAQRVDEREGEPVLWTEAGAPTAGTARRLAAQGYGGLVWAEGLPGTIGGAVYGNAGCYGGDMAQQLVRAWVLRDGEVEEWQVERFAYGYRTSALKARHAPDPHALAPSPVRQARGKEARARPPYGPRRRATPDARRSRDAARRDGDDRRASQGQNAGRLIVRIGVQESARDDRRHAARPGRPQGNSFGRGDRF